MNSEARSPDEDMLLPPRSVFSLSSSGELPETAVESIFEESWADRAPWRLLAFFCAIMFLVWFDNGLFASNGVTGCSKDCEDPVGFPTAQGDFGLSKFQLGLLAALFMVGLMLASILLTQLTSFVSPFRLVGLGMGVWVLAAAGGGLSTGFWTLLLARIFVGAGEASIITLSAPFIDDVAPRESVSLWFAILSSAPPIGVALGYIFGGLAEFIGWRSCFFIEAGVGLVIVFVAVFAPDVHLRSGGVGGKPGLEGEPWSSRLSAGLRGLYADLRILHRHPVFLLNTFAFAPIQAALGAFSFWGPKIGAELFHLDSNSANLSLGGLTIVCALLGIIGGGAALDFIGASIRNALVLQLASSLTGLCFCVLAVTLIQSTFWAFCLLFGIGLFALFVATAPLYAVGMWSVPAAQRPAGQAYLVVVMHVLGDVPSPPAVGAIQGWVRNWHLSMLAVLCYLLVSVFLYGVSIAASRRARDYRESDACST